MLCHPTKMYIALKKRQAGERRRCYGVPGTACLGVLFRIRYLSMGRDKNPVSTEWSYSVHNGVQSSRPREARTEHLLPLPFHMQLPNLQTKRLNGDIEDICRAGRLAPFSTYRAKARKCALNTAKRGHQELQLLCHSAQRHVKEVKTWKG